MTITYKINTASTEAVLDHFKKCNDLFIQRLSRKVNLADYIKKIVENAVMFEAWNEKDLVGLIAAYYNKGNTVFITNVSVIKQQERTGIGSTLLNSCIQFGKEQHFTELILEVFSENTSAIYLYKKNNFKIVSVKDEVTVMQMELTQNTYKEI